MRTAYIIFLVLILASCSRQQEVLIITGEDASPTLQFAAVELAQTLGKIYPGTQFIVSTRNQRNGAKIQLITQKESVFTSLNLSLPAQLEGAFTITHADKEAFIAGFDDFGVLQGVYRLLEKLGCDFQLSGDLIPARKEEFNFENWVLSDFPLQEERIVFNWHNFLSGCTGWDLEHWQNWILQSAKLGFNTIMIHSYGNNPIHAFEHKGIPKPVGYLSTTAKGRDWGTEHVNDVRRLMGGALFDEPVFGSSAALVEDSLRISAANDLMTDVFSYAKRLGMKIYFAFDMDTRSANPQEILTKLPDQAQLKTADGFSLANPDTQEGFAFYHSQIMALIQDYPQVDKLVAWTRKYNPKPPWKTPVRSLTPADFPAEWQEEYQEVLHQNPDLETDIYGPSTFFLGRILQAYNRIIAESNPDVDLGSGSWEFGFLPAAHTLYPENVSLYPLDFKVRFYESSVREELAKTGAERTLVPIVWAHHDDHRYMGKPYTPFDSFQTRLDEAGGAGFGIIHWLSRPLDIYFKSLSRQVWNNTVNEDLSDLHHYLSGKIFPGGSSLYEEFLNDWIHNAPMFGRETSDFFMDPGTFIIGETPTHPDSLLASIEYRIEILEKLNTRDHDPEVNKMVNFYLGLEYFYRSFIEQQQFLYQSNLAWMDGRYKDASDLIKNASPEKTIKAFSGLFQELDPTRGELAMIISLNLRWYPDFINQRQLSGLEPVRLNFQTTSHDPLAQAPGTFSFWMDEENTMWKGLDNQEMNSGAPFSINIESWRGQDLGSGKYRVIIHLENSLSESINLSLGANKLIKYRPINDDKKPGILFDIETKGGPIKLEVDPGGNKIIFSSMEIIPLKQTAP